jgi:ABC-type transporter Mla subunit MlaD
MENIELKQGQDELRQTVDELKLGQNELRQSVDELKQTTEELKQTTEELKQGQNDLKQSVDELKQITDELKQGQAELRHDFEELKQTTAEMRQDIDGIKGYLAVRLEHNLEPKINMIAETLLGLIELKPYIEQAKYIPEMRSDISMLKDAVSLLRRDVDDIKSAD